MKFKSIYKINYLSRIEVLNKTKFNKASFIISTYVIYLFLLILPKTFVSQLIPKYTVRNGMFGMINK